MLVWGLLKLWVSLLVIKMYPPGKTAHSVNVCGQAVGSELNIEDPHFKRARHGGVYSQFRAEETEMGRFLRDNSKLAYLGIQTSERA